MRIETPTNSLSLARPVVLVLAVLFGSLIAVGATSVAGHDRCDAAEPTVTVVTGARVTTGTPGDDVIIGNDLICAGAGNDNVHTASGREYVVG